MPFNLTHSIEMLQRTPAVLRAFLQGLSDHWLHANEGEGTWSPYDVVGHLIHGEKTDWIPRMEIILSDVADKTFEPFDRFAQLIQEQKPLDVLLNEFEALRAKSLRILQSRAISEDDLMKTGIHPAFGEVQLYQLLSTWVAHDLGHIAQISRVMAHQYKEDVGPWVAYLRILQP
ncbi:MAG: DinB family protein [Saprospiraceae bacterium]|nr:DinB family protein [Saprospiraceae bacterium]